MSSRFVVDDRVYTAQRLLGSGQTANVHLAHDASGQPVAVKVARAEAAISADSFAAEWDSIARLIATEREVHPWIDEQPERSHFTQLLDRAPDGQFFVMELARGYPLARVLSAGQELRVDQCLSIAIQLGEALNVVEAAGLGCPDLKPDAIFWDADADRLIIVDWNVVGPHPIEERPPHGLSAHVRITARYLDALLAKGAPVTEWLGPISTPPARWSTYYRAVALPLLQLIDAPEAMSLEIFTEVLRKVAAMFDDEPAHLLQFAVEHLGLIPRADPSRVEKLASEAAATAELAVVPHNRAVALRAQEAHRRALDYLSSDRDKLVELWRALIERSADARPDAGESIELIRLRALVGAMRGAPGYAEELIAVADHMCVQAWRKAGDILGTVRHRLESGREPHRLLADIEIEANALALAEQGMRALDEDRLEEGRDGLGRALEGIHQLSYADRLLARVPQIQREFDRLPGRSETRSRPAKVPIKMPATTSAPSPEPVRRRTTKPPPIPLAAITAPPMAPVVTPLIDVEAVLSEPDELVVARVDQNPMRTIRIHEGDVLPVVMPVEPTPTPNRRRQVRVVAVIVVALVLAGGAMALFGGSEDAQGDGIKAPTSTTAPDLGDPSGVMGRDADPRSTGPIEEADAHGLVIFDAARRTDPPATPPSGSAAKPTAPRRPVRARQRPGRRPSAATVAGPPEVPRDPDPKQRAEQLFPSVELDEADGDPKKSQPRSDPGPADSPGTR